MSVLLVLRLLRVLKSFRVMHFFPNFGKIVTGFKLAMRESWAVLASFAVIIRQCHAEDNNDDVKYQLRQMADKIDQLIKQLEEKNK